MTRDGAVAENLTMGETSSISERPQEENYSAPAGVAAEKVVQHIGTEIERHAAKGAEKKALDATQPKNAAEMPAGRAEQKGPSPREARLSCLLARQLQSISPFICVLRMRAQKREFPTAGM